MYSSSASLINQPKQYDRSEADHAHYNSGGSISVPLQFVGLKAVNYVSAVAMCFSFVTHSLSKVKDGQFIWATHASLKMKNGSDDVEARLK